ncbi:MAG: hypothetical protein K8T26_06550 [Lentisphaerae bacterium]|nr:hypothetical protein [Lentisphaerota bacterium]
MSTWFKRVLLLIVWTTAFTVSAFACHEDASHCDDGDATEHVCVCICHVGTAPVSRVERMIFARLSSPLMLSNSMSSGLDVLADIDRPPTAS